MKPVLFFLIGSLFSYSSLFAQSPDSVLITHNSLRVAPVIDSVRPVLSTRLVFVLKNKILNSEAESVSLAVDIKKEKQTDSFFYFLAAMVLLLVFLKYFYSRYFTNLFRVFFNTSLRQSQLTDQLLHAKLPSLLFNLFFIISGGLYVYLLLLHLGFIQANNKWILIFSSISLMGFIYFIKYCTLKFTGWVTGFTEITNTYIFVIFLINKIIGIFLVPFIIIFTYSDNDIVKTAVIISLMSIIIFLLLRFFRSYGLLQNQLKISRFHFLLYIAGIELLPLLLIYKGLMVYLSKNL